VASQFELEDIARRHDFLGASHDRNARRTLWVVGLTSLMMVGEIVAGSLTGSMALLADGFHMATHAGALGVAAAAYAYAKRHVANPHFTWGTGKVGDLAGFASALILGVIALGIAFESASRLFQPVRIDFGDATLVAVVGLLVNIASAALLSHGHADDDDHAHEHGHDHTGHTHEHHDHNIRAAYIHVLADALTSVLAIVALLSGRYLGWVWLDPVMGIVGALVISSWSWTLIRQTAAVLLDTANHRLIEQIRAAIELAGSARITDLHVWRVGPGAHAAIVSISGEADPEMIRNRLLGVCGLAHLTVETHEAP
jgi:cation diffusion facilitator family transporter